MNNAQLYFKNGEFLEENKLLLGGSEVAILELNKDKKEAVLDFKPGCNFVDKNVAKRQALSICKSGFLLTCGERIGSGYILTVKS